jgi:hypothetical protein
MHHHQDYVMKDIASHSFQCGLCEKRIDFGQDFYHHVRDGRTLNVCSICSSLIGHLGTWSREEIATGAAGIIADSDRHGVLRIQAKAYLLRRDHQNACDRAQQGDRYAIWRVCIAPVLGPGFLVAALVAGLLGVAYHSFPLGLTSAILDLGAFGIIMFLAACRQKALDV